MIPAVSDWYRKAQERLRKIANFTLPAPPNAARNSPLPRPAQFGNQAVLFRQFPLFFLKDFVFLLNGLGILLEGLVLLLNDVSVLLEGFILFRIGLY